MWSKPQVLILDEPTNFLDRDALGGLAVGIKEWTGAFLCISHSVEFVSALYVLPSLPSPHRLELTGIVRSCPEIWNVEGGRLTHKGKAAIIDESFESNPGSSRATPSGTPGASTPASSSPGGSTPAGSGDEANADATLAGVDAELAFKAAKGKKKMSRKQMKDREERRRLRTGAFSILLARCRSSWR